MWQATHFQSKKVHKGTESEILDLDNRIWIDKKPCQGQVEPNQPIAIIRTYLTYNPAFYCISGVFDMPIYSHQDIVKRSDNYWQKLIKIVN